MKVNYRSIVTTPGSSEPQGSAVVGGSGIKSGSNVAGPLRSSFRNREDTGVVNQAPVVLIATGKNSDYRKKNEGRKIQEYACIENEFDWETATDMLRGDVGRKVDKSRKDDVSSAYDKVKLNYSGQQRRNARKTIENKKRQVRLVGPHQPYYQQQQRTSLTHSLQKDKTKKEEFVGPLPSTFVFVPGQTPWVEVMKHVRKLAADRKSGPKPINDKNVMGTVMEPVGDREHQSSPLAEHTRAEMSKHSLPSTFDTVWENENRSVPLVEMITEEDWTVNVIDVVTDQVFSAPVINLVKEEENTRHRVPVVDLLTGDDDCSVPMVDMVSEENCSTPVNDMVSNDENNSVPVIDMLLEDDDYSVPVVNTSTMGVRYPHIWVSALGKKIVECLHPVIDKEDANEYSRPVINTAMKGVRYSHIWESATGPKMPKRLPPVLVTVRKNIRSVWSPEKEKSKEVNENESLPVVRKSVITEEVDENKETIDFMTYIATSLTSLNLRLLDLKVVKLKITSSSILEKVTDLLLQQALIRTKYMVPYAKLCATMANDVIFNAMPRDCNKTFQDVLEQQLKEIFYILSKKSRTTSTNTGNLSTFFTAARNFSSPKKAKPSLKCRKRVNT